MPSDNMKKDNEAQMMARGKGVGRGTGTEMGRGVGTERRGIIKES